MPKELLKMEGITKVYPNGFMANKDVTLAVNAGEIHALIGENGAGKTTLMKILFGHENCQEGRILINGAETKISNPLDAIAKGIGMVHQHFMLVPNLSVADNIMLGMEPGQGQVYDSKKAVQMVQEAADKYQLSVDPSALIRDLSVGYKQKVELLKALIRGARVLILDEPTAVLTPQETRELFVQLKLLREQGYGIIFISHKLEEVIELCDRCTVLRHGRVTGRGEIKDLNAVALSRMMVERDVILEIKKEQVQPKETIFHVDKLNYVNDIGKRVLNDVTFGVRAGEVVGIAGVEGNGQTELSEIISGLLARTDGKIILNGTETTGKSIKQIRQLGLAHISEDRMKYGIAPNLSVWDNIASIYLENKKFKKGLFLNTRELNKFVDNCIQEFEIACTGSSSSVRFLSGGNIQKVIIAREFCSGANFILANQPTRGIDVGTTDLIRRLLVRYTREKNYGSLLISSDLNEVMEVSDRLLVMHRGRFAAQFTDLKKLTTDELGEYMLGLKSMMPEEMGDLF
ncbi:ABC transporter ATP-binding protein [Lachnospiraceae bacterium oral taxon 500]|nr:ABC transporter ATP-binding protein [Lachnospiraceae bacterium oral taxon 500]